MKITMVGNRFVVETDAGRLHVLNEKSLRWNLKRVFGYTALQAAAIVKELSEVGSVEVAS
jgi:hypothetical protein